MARRAPTRGAAVAVALLAIAAVVYGIRYSPPSGGPEDAEPLDGQGEILRLAEHWQRAEWTATPTLRQRFLGSRTPLASATPTFVGQDQQTALTIRTPGSIRFSIKLGAVPVLRYAAGVPAKQPAARFSVAVRTEGGSSLVDSLEARAGESWNERRIDLSPWAGQQIELELAAEGNRAAQALWGNPRVLGARSQGPNVIVYLIDTLRADHLGAYGYPKPTSPVLDELAGAGVLFEYCFAQDSRTLGSIPSLLASLYPPSHGIDDFGKQLAPGTPTLQSAFAAAGFETASFVTNANAGTLPDLDRGFDLFHDQIKGYWNRDALRTLPEKAVTDWLDLNGDRRFFMYIHTAEPHRPYTPPPPYDTLFDPGYEGRITGYFEDENGYGSAKTEEDLRHVRALYDGEIRFADTALGRLLALLEARGLRDNTVVAITADHGEEFLDHGSFNHGQSLYNELLRVPLVMSGPGLPSGTRVPEPVQLIDLAPTLLELAAVPVPAAFEGNSLVRLAAGGERERFARREVYALSFGDPVRMAVVRANWKCVFTVGGDLELYDLDQDPAERHNLALEEPEMAAELLGRMRSWLDARRGRVQTAKFVEISPEDLERLKVLGYIN